ncbi:linear primary-alkylsulfatase-like [Ylistrum balloti]|uniref:linear primary-alkylsulfatase-like n=1 Tax=Ylistrum balloti TaxID=509963 RepID=UPI002905B44C|nr:linear primary-alkylsulfatase-like [Ylistrum balloti]
MEEKQVLFMVVLGIVALYLGNRILAGTGHSYRERILALAEPDRDLIAHTKEFGEPEVIKVTEDVYVAIGYALANSILLEGPNGLVVVDVTESTQSGAKIMAAFRNISDKPIKAIVYTHSHADHTIGASSFIEDVNNPPDIWAHKKVIPQMKRAFSTVNAATYTRSMRQFGALLPESVNAGIGLKLKYDTNSFGLVYPNKFVSKAVTDVTMAGIPVQIIHIPGETDDQIGVWIADRKIFLCADDVYRAFPNLYAIRGTMSRDLMQWVNSLDIMIELGPEYLIPSHTRPLQGKRYIRETLIAYRDAIQYVHDQTVRYINQGFTKEEIVELVKLPPRLAAHPFLQEFYGTVAWSVKGVFTSYIGWFSGDAVDLTPFTRKTKAEKMVRLVGANKLLDSAKAAYKEKDYQWALELSSHVLHVNKDNTEARDIKIDSLSSLGAQQTSANGRNYYLTSAFEEASEIDLKKQRDILRVNAMKTFPVTQMLNALPVRFKPEECSSMSEKLYFEFTDTKQHVLVTIRNSIAIITNSPSSIYDVKVSLTEAVFKEIVSSRARALTAYSVGELVVEGGLMKFRNIMGCFERD